MHGHASPDFAAAKAECRWHCAADDWTHAAPAALRDAYCAQQRSWRPAFPARFFAPYPTFAMVRCWYRCPNLRRQASPPQHSSQLDSHPSEYFAGPFLLRHAKMACRVLPLPPVPTRCRKALWHHSPCRMSMTFLPRACPTWLLRRHPAAKTPNRPAATPRAERLSSIYSTALPWSYSLFVGGDRAPPPGSAERGTATVVVGGMFLGPIILLVVVPATRADAAPDCRCKSTPRGASDARRQGAHQHRPHPLLGSPERRLAASMCCCASATLPPRSRPRKPSEYSISLRSW
jgi:hypothetical protein